MGGRGPAAKGPRRGKELGGKGAPGGWTANGGEQAPEGDERQSLGAGVRPGGRFGVAAAVAACSRGLKLKRGYLRMREASGHARVDGPGWAVGERRARARACDAVLNVGVRASAPVVGEKRAVVEAASPM